MFRWTSDHESSNTLTTRDARPFLAHHLRECADTRTDDNGAALHLLARWIENLPSDNAAMARIGVAATLDYERGLFVCGAAATALINDYRNDSPSNRRVWLMSFADAVERDMAAD